MRLIRLCSKCSIINNGLLFIVGNDCLFSFNMASLFHMVDYGVTSRRTCQSSKKLPRTMGNGIQVELMGIPPPDSESHCFSLSLNEISRDFKELWVFHSQGTPIPEFNFLNGFPELIQCFLIHYRQ